MILLVLMQGTLYLDNQLKVFTALDQHFLCHTFLPNLGSKKTELRLSQTDADGPSALFPATLKLGYYLFTGLSCFNLRVVFWTIVRLQVPLREKILICACFGAFLSYYHRWSRHSYTFVEAASCKLSVRFFSSFLIYALDGSCTHWLSDAKICRRCPRSVVSLLLSIDLRPVHD